MLHGSWRGHVALRSGGVHPALWATDEERAAVVCPVVGRRSVDDDRSGGGGEPHLAIRYRRRAEERCQRDLFEERGRVGLGDGVADLVPVLVILAERELG